MAVVRVRYGRKEYVKDENGCRVVEDRHGLGWRWYAVSKCRVVAPVEIWMRWQLNHLVGREVWGDGGIYRRR